MGESYGDAGRPGSREEFDDTLCDRRPEHRAAGRDHVHGMAYLGVVCALEQIPVGAGTHGSEYRIVVVEHREHENRPCGLS